MPGGNAHHFENIFDRQLHVILYEKRRIRNLLYSRFIRRVLVEKVCQQRRPCLNCGEMRLAFLNHHLSTGSLPTRYEQWRECFAAYISLEDD